MNNSHNKPDCGKKGDKPSRVKAPPPLPHIPDILVYMKRPDCRELAEFKIVGSWKPVLGAGFLLVLRLKNYWKYSGKFLLWDRRIRASWLVSNDTLISMHRDSRYTSREIWETGALFRLISSQLTRILTMLQIRGYTFHSISPPIFFPATIKSLNNLHHPELRIIHPIRFENLDKTGSSRIAEQEVGHSDDAFDNRDKEQ